MRASESANAAETGQIPANADGVIPGKASSNLNWLSVTYQGKSGFVNTRYLAYGESVGGYRLPVRLQCSGTEPFWGIQIGYHRAEAEKNYEETKQSLMLGDPIGALGQPNLWLLPSADPKDPNGFLLIEEEKCSDGMSETEYPYSLKVHMGGGLLSGCCMPSAQ